MPVPIPIPTLGSWTQTTCEYKSHRLSSSSFIFFSVFSFSGLQVFGNLIKGLSRRSGRVHLSWGSVDIPVMVGGPWPSHNRRIPTIPWHCCHKLHFNCWPGQGIAECLVPSGIGMCNQRVFPFSFHRPPEEKCQKYQMSFFLHARMPFYGNL